MQENNSLEMAMDDLRNIYAGSHSNSAAFDQLLTAMNDLCTRTDRLRRSGLAVGGRDKDDIRDSYERLVTACDKYLDGKGTSRYHGYGEGRLQCVREIRRIATMDIKMLESLDEYSILNIDEVTDKARRDEVTVDDSSAIKTVGANMSTRVPLSVQDPSELIRTGFFTEESTLSIDDFWKGIEENYHKEGLAPLRNALLADRGLQGFARNFAIAYQQIGDAVMMTKPGMKDSEVADFLMKDNNLDNFYRTYFEPVLREYPDLEASLRASCGGVSLPEKLKSDPAMFKEFLEMGRESRDNIIGHMVSTQAAAIPEGQDLAKRNVAMTRVAKLLGVPDLVARSENMSVTIDGKAQKGTFMETVHGEDVEHLKSDDVLARCGKETSLESPELIRQLSDLQVLDYICGNIDRHQGNMIYHTSFENGQGKIIGVTGIDNDASFGVIKGNDTTYRSHLVQVKDMTLMRKSTADAVRMMAQSRDTLEIALADLNFTKEELDAAYERVQKLDRAIENSADPDQDLRILDDNEFDSLTFASLKGRPGTYFKSISVVPGYAAERAQSIAETKPISYAPAKGNWRFKENTNPIPLDEVKAQVSDLGNLAKQVKDADRLLHINSGSYRWMRDSVTRLAARVDELSKTGRDDPLSEKDMKELDALYRDVNRAAANYLNKHAGLRKSGIGKNRVELAESMLRLEAPHVNTGVRQRAMAPQADTDGQTRTQAPQDAAGPQTASSATRVNIPFSELSEGIVNTHEPAGKRTRKRSTVREDTISMQN